MKRTMMISLVALLLAGCETMEIMYGAAINPIERAYMDELTDNGDNCWKYGIVTDPAQQSGPTTRHERWQDIPVLYVSYNELEELLGRGAYGFYDVVNDVVYVRKGQGPYTERHELCHAIHGSQHNTAAGLYESGKTPPEPIAGDFIARWEQQKKLARQREKFERLESYGQ